MKMTFRWYGSQSDPIPLKYIKQIPGMSGLMGFLRKLQRESRLRHRFTAGKRQPSPA